MVIGKRMFDHLQPLLPQSRKKPVRVRDPGDGVNRGSGEIHEGPTPARAEMAGMPENQLHRSTVRGKLARPSVIGRTTPSDHAPVDRRQTGQGLA